MSSIPRDPSPDSTLAWASEGYKFISNRCRRYRSDIFETRLMLQTAVCMMGEEAATVFYDGERFTRKGAMPKTALELLFDKGSVNLLDGEAHRWRKQMFMALMTAERIEALGNLTIEHWLRYIREWESKGAVVLFHEVQEILCRAICQWAGVPLAEWEVEQRTRDFGDIIDGAGSVGLRQLRGRWARQRTEAWIQDIIQVIRAGELEVPEESAAHIIAWHRDLDGRPLDKRVATVELMNILRPTVAVTRYIIFTALALHQYPECRVKLNTGDDQYADWFAQEVRRYYPFLPVIGGRVKKAFDWRGYHFPVGRWVIIDLYGTNHDPRVWSNPDAFDPERFKTQTENAFNLIPQGGGHYWDNHRCPGEPITIKLMKVALDLLTMRMEYHVPRQDLSINLSRVPAIPKSRFVISHVRARSAVPEPAIR